MNQAGQSNEAPEGFWEFAGNLLGQEGGIFAVLLLAMMFLFWRLIWNVWSSAMKAKDDEIDRIATERDKYQRLVFRNLLSSDDRDQSDVGED